jgi:uncharacterized protein
MTPTPLVQALRNAGAVSNDWVGKSAVGLVRVYQVGISAVMAPSCRFFPSCSAYCIEAIQVHGPWRGLALGARRIARCHPWNAGGVDMVPVRRHS